MDRYRYVGLNRLGNLPFKKQSSVACFVGWNQPFTAKNAKAQLEIEDLLKHLAGLIVTKELVKNIWGRQVDTRYAAYAARTRQ